MTVLLPNTRAGLRRSAEGGFTPHGERLPTGWGRLLGPHPARFKENPDGTWSLAIDMDLWPVRVNDLVIDVETGGSWLVQSSDPVTNSYDSYVDYVQVTALQRTTGGHTEPGGAWFVARHNDYVDGASGDGTLFYEAGLWTGHGPPPPIEVGVFEPVEGDEYLDLDTGTVYVLRAV